MYVFDASAAVKWFRPHEEGADVAIRLLEESSESAAWMPDQCVHELLAVAAREGGWSVLAPTLGAVAKADIRIAPLDAALVAETAATIESIGCCYYDALAPSLARLLGATLVSADRRAHGKVEGAIILG